MNFGPLLFLGAFLAFASAWIGLVFVPNQQLKDLQATQVTGSAVTNPRPYSGIELEGRKVYIAEGCVYCHSQQARGGQYNNDIERGWGAGPVATPRRSHPQDYIYDYPVLLGTMRTGPDLANIGARQGDVNWHLRHLYDPRSVSPGSIMPPFRYLFEKRKIVGEPSPDAMKIDGSEKGYELVPTDRAKALVAYLKSLDHSYSVGGVGDAAAGSATPPTGAPTVPTARGGGK